jgi:hypothetical protein
MSCLEVEQIRNSGAIGAAHVEYIQRQEQSRGAGHTLHVFSGCIDPDAATSWGRDAA